MKDHGPCAVFNVQLGFGKIEMLNVEMAFKSALPLANGIGIECDRVVAAIDINSARRRK